MSLTGIGLPIVLGVIALAMFVLLVAGRPARRRPLAMLGRGGEALAMNIAAIGLCGALLNDQFLFYTSWSDLINTDQSTTATSILSRGSHGTVRNDVAPTITFPAADATLPALPDPNRRLQTYTVKGDKSGITGQVLVLLPKGYDPKSTTRYPVIEALHGWPGGPDAVNHELSLTDQFQKLVDEKKIAAPIVVMPQINTPMTVDTECVDAPPQRGILTATWLGHDIPQWTADHFRVAHTRTSWLVAGASYGGWCAATTGMHFPSVFGGAVSFMGYFAPEFYGYRPYANDPAGLQTYDLTWLAKHHPPPIAMWLMCSKQDRGAYGSLVPFLKAARPPLSVTAHVLLHGGHNVDTIPPTLPAMMTWLAKTLPGFAPSH